ncbi:hypothetical protein [Fictibacillus macauensis]|nr:hypothetical protein [Fictibacillus macauensis]
MENNKKGNEETKEDIQDLFQQGTIEERNDTKKDQKKESDQKKDK